MDAEQFAAHLADQLRRMSKGQYLLLVSALREAGGTATVQASSYVESVSAPVPTINLQVIGEGIMLELQEANGTRLN